MVSEQDKLPGIAFIVGIGRSGTTLLTNMLNSHGRIIATPENEFLLFTEASFRNKNFSDPEEVKKFMEVFNYDFNTVLSIWKPGEGVINDIQSLKKKSFANVCKLAYLNYPFGRDKKAIDWIIDKNPVYSLYIEKLVKIYPQARFIVLVRDFRDNVLSRVSHSATAQRSIFNLGIAWNYYYQQVFASLKKHKLSYQLVRYEDLVTNPEATLREICKYLEVEYSSQMLSFQDLSKEMMQHVEKSTSSATYAKVTKMHGNLTGEVNLARLKAYEKEFTPEQIAALEYICGEYALRFNYVSAKHTPRLSWFVKSVYNKIKVHLFYGWQAMYYNLPVGLRLLVLKKNSHK